MLSKRGTLTARTTDAERRRMFALYEQGHGTHAIASRMGRSKHTLYGVLTHRKTRSLPERPVHPVPEAGKTRDTKAGKRKREREDTAKLSAAQGIEGRLLERLEPRLERALRGTLAGGPRSSAPDAGVGVMVQDTGPQTRATGHGEPDADDVIPYS